MNRRRLLKSAAVALCPAACGQKQSRPPLPYATLADLAAMLQAGQTTPALLVEHFLARIAQIDQAGPRVNAVLELNPAAKDLAAACKPGALHGLPILIKDNIETADGMHTTAGSLALRENKPQRDAALVTRLREAGALILGKTNLSEWANIRSPNSTSGWSARGGLTRNPHRLTHSASGSSSGSAAAVAAGLAPAAIGTETNGSIVSPASACGIVGFKPTVGLINGSGIIPITHWQDTAGPMTLTVRDAALLMQVLAGNFTVDLKSDAIKGARLGVARSQCGKNAQVLALFETALEKLRAAGAIIVDRVKLPNMREAGALAWKAMLIELRTDLNAYLKQRAGDVRSLAELIAFNEQHREAEMPHFRQEFFEQAEHLGTPEIIAAGAAARENACRLAGPEGIDAALQAHQLDALIFPTNDPVGLINLAHGDTNERVASTPAAVAGYPHLTVPLGFVDALPIGFSFIGTANADARILELGHAFEQLTQARRTPEFHGRK
ncbi:amidase [Prosthecobacter sp.]|uniref:amidase n=1 Tax=Prosthecobacter sp. TaxID=1965333 RepID=UPI00248A3858|nr:amidase [Prosthecobacter sp.]MDI1312604.1 amidase [Prosthecobacter sp.]